MRGERSWRAESGQAEQVLRFSADDRSEWDQVAQTILLKDLATAVNFRMQRIAASVQLVKALGGGWGTTRTHTGSFRSRSGFFASKEAVR